MTLLAAAGDWYRNASESHVVASVGATAVSADQGTGDDAVVGQVLGLALRPFCRAARKCCSSARSSRSGRTRTAGCAAVSRTSP